MENRQRRCFRISWIEACRVIAVGACESGRPITIDTVRALCAVSRPDIKFGSWAGAIFRHKGWRSVGVCKSTHKGGHERLVRMWKYDHDATDREVTRRQWLG
jgi:hypothetical protein